MLVTKLLMQMDDLHVRFDPARQEWEIRGGHREQLIILDNTEVVRLRHMLRSLIPGDEDEQEPV